MAMGRMRALYILTFSELEMSWLVHTVLLSLPNAQAASLVRLLASAATDGTLLPKKTKSSTLSTGDVSVVVCHNFAFCWVNLHVPFAACMPSPIHW